MLLDFFAMFRPRPLKGLAEILDQRYTFYRCEISFNPLHQKYFHFRDRDLSFLTCEHNVLKNETHIVRLLNIERINYGVIHLIDNNMADINSEPSQTKGWYTPYETKVRISLHMPSLYRHFRSPCGSLESPL